MAIIWFAAAVGGLYIFAAYGWRAAALTLAGFLALAMLLGMPTAPLE
jgi:hypothetical protein